MATASEIKKRLKGVSEIELRSVGSSGRGSLYSTLIFVDQYKHADMAASDIATMLTNFRNLRMQDIKLFGKMYNIATH